MPDMRLHPGRPVIIDTDMAADDLVALLFLLHAPGIRVEAITVAGTGEVHGKPGARNAAALIALAEAGDIPIAYGRETPLRGTHVFPPSWRTDADGLYGFTLPDRIDLVSEQSAPDLLASVIEAASEKVTLLTLGPLTNVAEALQGHPALIDKLEIYAMGGALRVPGNVGTTGGPPENESAEWNIFIDPRAANIVFGCGAPVTLVPLDATVQVPLTPSLVERIRAGAATASGAFTADLIERIHAACPEGLFMWDSLAAAILTDNTLAGFDTVRMVVVEEGPQAGRTVSSIDGPSVRVACRIDVTRFEQVLIDTLNRVRLDTRRGSPIEQRDH